MMSSYRLALAHYRIIFPDLDSLGASAATWRTEYDRVSGPTFDQVTLTSANFEGGQGSGHDNFDQGTLLKALHARRSELDSTYTGLDPRTMGVTVLLGDGFRATGLLVT